MTIYQQSAKREVAKGLGVSESVLWSLPYAKWAPIRDLYYDAVRLAKATVAERIAAECRALGEEE